MPSPTKRVYIRDGKPDLHQLSSINMESVYDPSTLKYIIRDLDSGYTWKTEKSTLLQSYDLIADDTGFKIVGVNWPSHKDDTLTVSKVDLHMIMVGDRVRSDMGDIEALSESLSKIGLVNPIRVRPVSNHYELVAGERRLLAAQQLGWSSIPAIVAPATDTESEDLEVAENSNRKDFSPSEIGQFALEVWDTTKAQGGGNTRDMIGRKLGVSGVHVERCKNILEWCDANPKQASNVKLLMDEAGAKAAERFIKAQDKTVRAVDEKPADIEALFICNPEELGGIVKKAGVKCIITNPKTDTQYRSIGRLAHECLTGPALCIVGVPKDSQLPALMYEIEQAGLCYLGLISLVGKAEASIATVWSTTRRIPPVVKFFKGETIEDALKAMVEEYTDPGNLIVDPCIETGSVILAASGRRLIGADLDGQLVEQAEENWITLAPSK